MPTIQIDKINYVVKGETGNIINLDVRDNDGSVQTRTFMTDTGREVADISSTSMTHRIIKTTTSNNKNIFFDMIGSDAIIYALFDFKDVAIKSSVGIDLYAPHLSSNPVGFCTVVNSNSKVVSYGMSELTTASPIIKGTNLRDTRKDRMGGLTNSMYWNYKMIESGNKTYLGIPLSNLTFADTTSDDEISSELPDSYFQFLQSYGKLSTDMVSTLFDPKYNLDGVCRNYIYQISLGGSTTKTYNDFNSGDINGDFVISKTPYDSEYSMDMSTVSEIKNARHYDGIGTVGGRVFFKYHDDINFKHESDQELSTSLSHEVQNLSTTMSTNADKENNFQRVEMLDSISQFKSVSQHKSNLFSIKIRKLFDNITDEVISNNLSKIKADINRRISKIVDSFAPAHTQLFDIIYDNKTGAAGNSQENSGVIGDIIFLFTYGTNDTEISGLTKRGQYENTLRIPANVTSILDGALNQSIENIMFLTENGNTTFEVKNSSLYESSSNTLISYPVNNSAAKYIISDDTLSIYTSAFYNCRKLRVLFKPLSIDVDLDIPDEVTLFDYYDYTIKFLNDGKTDDALMPPQKVYTYNTNRLQLNRFTKTGNIFKNWEYGNDKFILDGSYIEQQLSDDYGDVYLSAKWDPISYVINFNAGDDTVSGRMDDMYMKYGDLSSLTNNTFKRTGYHFTNWVRYLNNNNRITYLDGALISNLTTVDNDIIKLYTAFDANTYYIKFRDNSGIVSDSTLSTLELTCRYDISYTLKDVVEKTGILGNDEYILRAWRCISANNIEQILPLYEDEIDDTGYIELKNLIDKNESDVIFDASWTTKYYVEFNGGVEDGIAGTMPTQYFAYCDNTHRLAPNAFVRDGYKFSNWTYTIGDTEHVLLDNAIVDNLIETPGGTVELSAVWNKLYTIVFDANGGFGEMENQEFTLNDVQQLFVCNFSRSGYEFRGWNLDKRNYATDTNIMDYEVDYRCDHNTLVGFEVTEDILKEYDPNNTSIITLYAAWEPNKYRVRFHKNIRIEGK